ncbi:MAG: VOC family protein [Granulosicoccus sp.]|nr:VOC family protein [Granulosicoccus sp.]
MTLLKKPVSFIATANSDKSRHFYEKVLDLQCLSDDPYALVFALADSTLRIQKVDSVADVGYTVLGWEVDDIEESVAGLTSKGIKFAKFSQLPQDDNGIWNAPGGARVAWFKDPDGNTLSLTEP